jgi:cysteine desulfurase
MSVDRATYLDWNATAPVLPEVASAVAQALATCGNASSVHRWGRAARRAVEAARAAVGELAGTASDWVTFTSGGSEANHLALRGLAGRRVILSAIEHDSVRAAAPAATLLPVGTDGCADLAALERLLAADPRPALVSLMRANNETGAIQDVATAARLAHAHGALLHTDAVQAAGKMPLDMAALGADLMTLSAHKIGGPQGVGVLVARPDLALAPMIAGGGQEQGRRSGTENVPGIVGFGVAARLAAARLGAYARLGVLRDEAERRLVAIAPGASVFAAGVKRLANTLCIAMPGVPAATQVMALDLAGVMVSAGAACSSGKLRRSPVLTAMGVPDALADCAIRISLGWSTGGEDIDHLVAAWGALHARTRASAA